MGMVFRSVWFLCWYVWWMLIAQCGAQSCQITNLHQYENSIYSQNGEDGVLIALLGMLGIEGRNYVEFGVEDGTQCNSRILREHYNFTGLMMDGDAEKADINLRREFITVDNILSLFAKYSVPQRFDLLSIDVDMFDWWILAKILGEGIYRPRIILAEVNPTLGIHKNNIRDQYAFFEANAHALTVQHPHTTNQTMWDLTRYSGGNPRAFQQLGNLMGYEMIYCETCGVNCFLVLRSELPKECHHLPLPLVPFPCYSSGANFIGHEVDELRRKPIHLTTELIERVVENRVMVDELAEFAVDTFPHEEKIADWCSWNYTDLLGIQNWEDVEKYYPGFETILTESDKLMRHANIAMYCSAHALKSSYSCNALASTFQNIGIGLLHSGEYANAEELFSTAFVLDGRSHRTKSYADFFHSLRNLATSFTKYVLVTHTIYYTGNDTPHEYSVGSGICDNFYDILDDHFNLYGFNMPSRDFGVSKFVDKFNHQIMSGFPFAITPHSRAPLVPPCLEGTVTEIRNAISSFCAKREAQRNFVIYGPPASGVEYITQLLREVTKSHVHDDVQHAINEINYDFLGDIDCNISNGVLYNCDAAPALAGGNLSKEILRDYYQQQYAERMYTLRMGIDAPVLVVGGAEYSFLGSRWYGPLGNVTTVLVVSDPRVTIPAMMHEYACSLDEAVAMWVQYFDAALLQTHLSSNPIFFVYNGARIQVIYKILLESVGLELPEVTEAFLAEAPVYSMSADVAVPVWIVSCYDSLVKTSVVSRDGCRPPLTR